LTSCQHAANVVLVRANHGVFRRTGQRFAVENAQLTIRASWTSRRVAIMPSLMRFLLVVGIIFGLGYAAIFALATLVDPKPREITVTVPPDKFVKPPR